MWVGLIVGKCHAVPWASDSDQSAQTEGLEWWLWTGNTGSCKGPATGGCSCVHYGPSSFSSPFLAPSLQTDCLDTKTSFSLFLSPLFSFATLLRGHSNCNLCTGGFVSDFFCSFFLWHEINEMGNRTSHCYTNSSLHSNYEKCFSSSVSQFQTYSLTRRLGERQEVKTFPNWLAHCEALKAGYWGEQHGLSEARAAFLSSRMRDRGLGRAGGK